MGALVIAALVFVLVPIWGIIDAAVRPDDVWRSAQQSKVVWILVQIFLGIIGTVTCVVAVRPKLTAIAPGLPPVRWGAAPEPTPGWDDAGWTRSGWP